MIPSNQDIAKTPFSEIVQSYEEGLKQEQNATTLTIKTLDMIDSQTLQNGSLRSYTKEKWKREHWYTRLATAITTWATKKDLNLSIEDFEKLCLRKNTLVSIFAASGYRSTKHFIDLLAHNNNGQKELKKEKILPLLALLSLDDTTDELMDVALLQQPMILLNLMLGWLTQRAVLTEQGERNRTKLLSSGERIKEVKIESRHIPRIASAWMYCSYASTPNKHDIKKVFNHLLKDLMKRSGINPTPVKYKKKEKSKMMIIHERFTSVHAMYRCYGTRIKTFKTKFEVIGLAEEKEIDETSSKLHDRTLKIDLSKTALSDIIKIIQKESPDIIYYPSVGMKYWAIMLANLRLAPLQIASQGHPATTMSDVIDYVILPEFENNIDSVYSEPLLKISDSNNMELHLDLPDPLPKKTREDISTVHIAVNSKVMKLSYRLLNICKKLSSEASHTLHFHFFPGEKGIKDDAIEKLIQKQVPNSTIYGYKSYPEFLQLIKNCDISLAAFPFGNTNSTVDTSLLGVPTIAHFGAEAPSQSDKRILSFFNAPDWLIQDTDEGYYQSALRLINSQDEREKITKILQNNDTRKNLFSCDNSNGTDSYLKLIENAFSSLSMCYSY